MGEVAGIPPDALSQPATSAWSGPPRAAEPPLGKPPPKSILRPPQPPPQPLALPPRQQAAEPSPGQSPLFKPSVAASALPRKPRVRVHMIDVIAAVEEARHQHQLLTKGAPDMVLDAGQVPHHPEKSKLQGKGVEYARQLVLAEALRNTEDGPVTLSGHSKHCLDPRSSVMRHWDAVIIMLLVYTATITPFEARGRPAPRGHACSRGSPAAGRFDQAATAQVAFTTSAAIDELFFVNRGVDCLFVMDMALQFFVAFWDEQQAAYNFSLKAVAVNYLRGWFPLDLISIAPFDTVSALVHTSNQTAQRALSVIRLFRLLKLLRILRAGRIFKRLESQIEIDYAQLQLAQFGVMIIIYGHWMACLWGLVQRIQFSPNEYNAPQHPRSWYTETLFDGAILPKNQRPSVLDEYIVSLYWVRTLKNLEP